VRLIIAFVRIPGRLSEGCNTDTNFEICIDAAHPALNGHFPGDPIVPGVLLLGEVITRLAAVTIFISGIRKIHFMRPIRPKDRIVVNCRRDASGQLRFECRVGDVIVVRGSFVVKNDVSDD